MELKNKVAIVTGVSKGIGLATVKTLLEKGCKVAGWGRTNANLEHDNYYFYKTDVRNVEEVNASYDATISDLGVDIAILVNNAGLGFEGGIEKIEVNQWHQMFETNVDGIFYCSRLVIPQMKANDEGHIINISSIAGNTGIPNMAAYCATKHAVMGLSHAMYKELRNFGIKVTCVYPGSVKTNFFDKIDSVTINDGMMMPEDIASTIVHCLESQANYHHVDIEVRPLKPRK
ncbi:short-chain dehydrogenase/reductase SDR [Fulvivirga imtechensis AK7]|uniref:Short-chain dehydrogenase/reductase SDR n=1 Tax=Fulvivirga imtechensis AK7 TaxID=1237149 RepID=L8JL53_9BACT|nr:SDR family oxidoreductase [Fulvivirga imtechensis]ELR69661.1 short-chain dehydrogenase/reductase SDR [Fulvivirga imtechensis AK7]